MDPHPRPPHGSAFEQYVSLDEYRRPDNATRPPVWLRDPQTLLVWVSSFSLDNGYAARFAVRSLALAVKLDSSGAQNRLVADVLERRCKQTVHRLPAIELRSAQYIRCTWKQRTHTA